MTTFQSVVLIWAIVDVILAAGISAVKLIGTHREHEMYPPIRGSDWYGCGVGL